MFGRRKRARWRWIEWETEHFQHRPLKLRDAFDVFECLQDQALTQYMHDTRRQRLIDVLRFTLKAKWRMYRRTTIYYVRIYKPEGRVVAMDAVMGIDPYAPHNAELGVWWVREFWGHPIRKTEVRTGIWLVFMFEEVGLFRIEYRIKENNIRTIKSLRKAGVRFEGVHREDAKEKDGYTNMLQWSSNRTAPRTQRRIAEVTAAWGWPPRPGILDPSELPSYQFTNDEKEAAVAALQPGSQQQGVTVSRESPNQP